MQSVAIVMGSDSDLSVMQPAIDQLAALHIPFEVRVISAHRTPDLAMEFSKSAAERGVQVIIAAAGKAAHLAGNIAANTLIPVIGVPVQSSALSGLDALLSTVQMPPGIPVATVAIDGAKNAALLAAQILGLNDTAILAKLQHYRRQMAEENRKKDEALCAKYTGN